jgi:hypothetical protein
MEGSFLRGLSDSLTLHSFSVTLFALGSRLFLIQLQINTHLATFPAKALKRRCFGAACNGGTERYMIMRERREWVLTVFSRERREWVLTVFSRPLRGQMYASLSSVLFDTWYVLRCYVLGCPF